MTGMTSREFDRRYREDPDPWGYRTSPYERAKYAATLDACGPGPFVSALELGGSIGVFSALLAPRCRSLTTIDYSPTAVSAAEAELARYPHARAILGRIPDDLPPATFDLIVASEVLYYLDGRSVHRHACRDRAAPGSPGAPRVRALAKPRPGTTAICGARSHRDPPSALAAPDLVGVERRVSARQPGGDVTERYALLVIGGGPAGLAAARAYRQQGGGGRVAIVSDEHRMPYQRPPLTKELLRGEASEADLPIESGHWLTQHRIDLVAGRVVTLDAKARVAELSGGRELPYEQCLLATGAEPTRLPVPGGDHPAVRVLRTLDHLRELTAQLGDTHRVVVVGSGFIGCEIASSLRRRGHPVMLISDEPAPNAERLGAAAAEILAGWLADDGVELRLGTAVDAIEHDGSDLAVRAGRERVPGQIVVMAVGVQPRTELAVQAGIDLRDGAIPTDAAMRTARDGVLAAGDVCLAANLAAGRALRVEHWGDALTQGEIAGKTAAGASAGWDAVPGFWSTIGQRTLKYAAWGDGYDATHLDHHASGGFTVRYGSRGRLVGVLTHEADGDYEHGSEQIAEGAPWDF